MKKFLNLLATLLVTVLLCTGCEKKNIVDSIAEMYDDGIETVDKAKSVDDVQQYYNDINKKVEVFKQNHLKEMAALDSAVAKIEEAKMIFTKACCIKASSFEGYIKDTNGVVIAVNEAGIVLPLESIEGDDGLVSNDYEDDNNSNSTNPLGFIGVIPVYEQNYNDIYDFDYWNFKGITIQNSKGDYLYSDEDAERYYEHYLALFFMSYQIANGRIIRDGNVIDYMKKNLSYIVSNLPLDDSFPDNIREYVNKIYYDHKDEISTVHISERGYGYIECKYFEKCNRNEPRFFYLKRDKNHNGRFVITGMRYDIL